MSYSRINSSLSSLFLQATDPDHINEDRITIGTKIGEGGYSEIVAGLLDNKIPIAIKHINGLTLTGDFQKTMEFKVAELELDVLFRLREEKAPNVVRYFGYQSVPFFGIVMENAGIGLDSYIESHKDTLSLSSGCEIMERLSQAVRFLHALHYVHRDIKSDNVLISETGQVKLCDFGMTAKIEENGYLSGMAGSLLWMAPEIINGKPYTEKVDIFSMGVVFWEVTMRNPNPYEDIPMPQVLSKVAGGYREHIPEDCNPDLRFLITTCWHQNPQERPNAGEVVDRLQPIKKNLATFFGQSSASNAVLAISQADNNLVSKPFQR